MSFSARLLSGLLALSIFAAYPTYAAVSSVFGPKVFSPAGTKPLDSKSQFVSKSAKGELKVINGDGKDVQYKVCSGNLLKKILCETENYLTRLELSFTRPSSFSIEVNGVVVLNQVNLPITKGRIAIPTSLIKGTNNLRVKVAGYVFSRITLEVTQTTDTVNQAPIASFQMSASQGFAPLTATMNALGSRDPDGSIACQTQTLGISRLDSLAVSMIPRRSL